MENKECGNCRLYDPLYLKLDFYVYLETNYGRCRKDCIKKRSIFGDVKECGDVCGEWSPAENNFHCETKPQVRRTASRACVRSPK